MEINRGFEQGELKSTALRVYLCPFGWVPSETEASVGSAVCAGP